MSNSFLTAAAFLIFPTTFSALVDLVFDVANHLSSSRGFTVVSEPEARSWRIYAAGAGIIIWATILIFNGGVDTP